MAAGLQNPPRRPALIEKDDKKKPLCRIAAQGVRFVMPFGFVSGPG
jgi:hypothetical protein